MTLKVIQTSANEPASVEEVRQIEMLMIELHTQVQNGLKKEKKMSITRLEDIQQQVVGRFNETNTQFVVEVTRTDSEDENGHLRAAYVMAFSKRVIH